MDYMGLAVSYPKKAVKFNLSVVPCYQLLPSL